MTKAEAEATGSGYYLPTKEELRHQLYQIALSTCRGVGYYSFKDGAYHLYDQAPAFYNDMKAIAAEDLPLIKTLLRKQHEVKTVTETDEYRSYTLLVDGKIYWLILNMQNKVQTLTFDAELDAVLFAGADLPQNLHTGENTISLPAHGVAVYKEKTS